MNLRWRFSQVSRWPWFNKVTLTIHIKTFVIYCDLGHYIGLFLLFLVFIVITVMSYIIKLYIEKIKLIIFNSVLEIIVYMYIYRVFHEETERTAGKVLQMKWRVKSVYKVFMADQDWLFCL